jgi:broad specificity phosphatase PhoE
MLRIILVRHGESTYNLANMVQGRGSTANQSVLTDKGIAQAQLAGQAIANIPFQQAYSSPLQRAKQTAEIILSYQPSPPQLITHEGLYEIDLRGWEGMTFSEIQAQFPEQFDHWQDAPHKLCLDGFYPVVELFHQAQRFWQDLLSQWQTVETPINVLLVAHSGINRALICTALGIDIVHYHHLQQNNCGISVLNYRSGQWQLEALNLTSHLKSLTGSFLPPVRKHHTGQRIILVRHGETEWNRQKRFQGQIDIPLNGIGETQSLKTADFLAEVTIHRAFSSPLLRPKQTASLILTKHPAVTLELVPELREICHGLWEGKLESEVKSNYGEALARWQTQPETVQMPEGENLNQVWERVAQGWQRILEMTNPGETSLVVAHDAVNKAILCQLFGLTPSYFWVFKQGNGGITVIDYPKGREHAPHLQAVNITTHLSDSVLDTTTQGAL